jgi:hypothetical protein
MTSAGSPVRVLLIDPDPRRAGEIDALLGHSVPGDDPATVARRQAIEEELAIRCRSRPSSAAR